MEAFISYSHSSRIWSFWTPCCAHTYTLCGNFTASLFSFWGFFILFLGLDLAVFCWAPYWAPCCDPLLNILYHLNLPAVTLQTAEALPHVFTEISVYCMAIPLCLVSHMYVSDTEACVCDLFTTDNYLFVTGMCFQDIYLIISTGWTGHNKEIEYSINAF